MPLSKQVLLNRAPHVDDSFSSIPDSILQAATPGRLPMKPAATHVADRDENMYEDSFSEIPDEVLTAATPKPARPAMQLDQADLPSPEGETQSATRSTNIGSDRLPTPDDTNSSATDAKNGHGEDAQRLVIGSTAPVNTSDLNIRSSPPTISRQFNTMNIQSESAHTISRHFDTMALQSEQSEQSRADQTMAGTPPRETSSPHLGLANSGSAENAQMLQPPQHGRRPTLSPIVRAGRTLQNILSDRSSPDEQGSLGSPFRGSLQSNSRQSSLSRSPARAASHRRTGSDSRALFSSMALSQSIRSAFGSSQRASSLPAPDLAPALLPVPEPAALPVQTENSSRPNMLDSSHIEMSRRPDQGFEHGQTNGLIDRPETNPEAPSSSRVALPSEQGHHQETSSGFGQEDLSSPATQRSRRISASLRAANSSAFGKRGFRSSQLRDIVSESDSGLEEENIEEQDEQIEEEQVEEETTEPIDGHDEEVIESQEEQHEEEHIFDDILDQEDSLEIDRDNGQEVADQGGSEREQQETVSGETSFDVEDDDGDDVDLWDIEASRPTPRANKIRQSQVQVGVLHPAPAAPVPAAPAAVDADPPRPAKITSPWRRNARRLIYQDEFRSPSEIEMEDSPPSVIGRATSVPQTDAERASPLPQVKPKQVSSRSQIEVERAHPAPPRGGQQERVIEASPEPPQKEIDMEQEQTGEDYEVEYSHELMEREESDEPQEPPQALNQMKRKAPLVEHSVVQEYSMAEGNQAEEEQEPEQPAPARRSFFGRGFDILSFFSSPRPPPTTNDPPRTQVDETPVHRTTAKPLPRSVQSIQNSLPEEPQSALRATGLFPSIRQKIFNPSPERRVDLFSPGTALRSNDTVADTYDEAPSTPEQLEFDSIPQKRNFTPLSGQSRNTASLFTPSRQGSTPAQELRTPSSEYDDFREKDFSDEAEESGFTDGPSFEHIPPREKPSHWDKNLSPTKSCMRSPLKPKTPGRVVEFTSTVLSPRAQEKARVDRQRVLNTVSNVSVNIATNNPRTAIINPSPLRIPPSYQSREYNKENTISPSKSPGRQFNQSAPATRPQAAAAAKLSPTSWTRAHWMRLDEILQLRKRDPMQFQMYFPSVAPYKHPLAGLEVAAQDAKMVLEDWHLEVVEAFRAELTAAASKSFGENEEETNDAWDDKALSKRLFALMVGEERRRSGKYVSGRAGNSRQG